MTYQHFKVSGTLAERATQLIELELGIEPGKARPDATLWDDLGADSLDQVELMITLEREFGIEITDEAWSAVRAVGDVVALCERLVAGLRAPGGAA